MRIALTGTPGVGKSTLAALVAGRPDWTVVDVKGWARQAGVVDGYDSEQDAEVIDVVALAARIEPERTRFTLYEGHLSHLLPVDVAWVVRLDPVALQPRLAARGYPRWKVEENLEAEALDLILQEALDEVPRVIQRDGTRRTPEQLLSAFTEATDRQLKGHDLEAVDWSDRLPLEE